MAYISNTESSGEKQYISFEDVVNYFLGSSPNPENFNSKQYCEELLGRANLSEIPVKLGDIVPHQGYNQVEVDEGILKVIAIFFRLNDPRDAYYRIKTVLHECYHSKLHELEIPGDSDFLQNKKLWTVWEETATETAAFYMMDKIGFNTKNLIPSYWEFLIKTLPLLKNNEEFKDCKYLSDFGKVFLERRFIHKSVEVNWNEFSSVIDIDGFNLSEYALQYKEEAYAKRNELLEIIFEMNKTIIPDGKEEEFKKRFAHSFDSGWEQLKDFAGPAFNMSLAILMNKMGVLKC
ncbi:hypothetical protein [Priestia aryabhattai]|uniref:hypothetical protein n=1 Tax=Priestia aryabhattai TaxID=412384 RepID=UPI0015935E06